MVGYKFPAWEDALVAVTWLLATASGEISEDKTITQSCLSSLKPLRRGYSCQASKPTAVNEAVDVRRAISLNVVPDDSSAEQVRLLEKLGVVDDVPLALNLYAIVAAVGVVDDFFVAESKAVCGITAGRTRPILQPFNPRFDFGVDLRVLPVIP